MHADVLLIQIKALHTKNGPERMILYLLGLYNGLARDYAKGDEYPMHIQAWQV